MKNDLTSLVYPDKMSRRQVSKKPPITMSFNQSCKAERENNRAMREDRSFGIFVRIEGASVGSVGGPASVVLTLVASVKDVNICCTMEKYDMSPL